MPDNERVECKVVDSNHQSSLSLLREITNLDRIMTTRLDSMDKAMSLFNENMVRVPTELDKRLSQLQAMLSEKFANVDTKFSTIDKVFNERDFRFNKLEESHRSILSVEIDKIYETFKMIENSLTLRFDSVDTQFTERDTRASESSLASQKAIDAALQSQKESASEQTRALIQSINKSEDSTQKQLEQQRTVLIAVEKTLSDKISDVADRLNRWEGTGDGKAQISAPLWAMGASILTALMIAGLMMLFNKPANDDKTLNRLDNIEQIIQRHETETQKLKGNGK